MHHNLFDQNIYDKYVIKCNRLLDLIKTEQNICFIYTNVYHTYIDEAVKFP